ncbi:MAG TPA: hypothetical protein DHW61_16020 [Lachnoclostridium phytofermentans]|uniref:Uncharacterized protein n=1 Tax=Lachnoclostridium phytofermentans TaxID=66219 RepID=A0A3D2XAW7_9FIRM|nr:hypothetical protein [Lachnoclostridium sp.]HCL03887.1 hypothetical protein [Lachnoclostridium phytofermentans]
MKKNIFCKPLNEIVLEFESGEKITLLFDIVASMEINYNHNNLSIPELCTQIICAGSHGKLTEEKARDLVCQLQPLVIVEILTEFYESMGVIGNEALEEQIKKATAQFLNKIMSR